MVNKNVKDLRYFDEFHKFLKLFQNHPFQYNAPIKIPNHPTFNNIPRSP